jgi:hypothetical protein
MASSSPQPEHDPRAAMRRLAQGADRICRLILDAELPEVDVDIAINNLRDEADELFPGSGELFDRIYESRFLRLREQFPRGVPG